MYDHISAHFTKTLKCKRESFPLTYLELPLGKTRPTLDYFIPMIRRVERRLCVTSEFLNYGGELEVVKYELCSFPILSMFTLDAPPKIKNQVIKYMSHCL
jgi:hypothetical protein